MYLHTFTLVKRINQTDPSEMGTMFSTRKSSPAPYLTLVSGDLMTLPVNG